jgi:hypothetical protein
MLLSKYLESNIEEEELTKHGFKGGKSLQHPIKNNEELLKYIDEVFDEE